MVASTTRTIPGKICTYICTTKMIQAQLFFSESIAYLEKFERYSIQDEDVVSDGLTRSNKFKNYHNIILKLNNVYVRNNV